MTFKALLTTTTGEKISTDLVELDERDLMPGDVTVTVEYSTVNYKDSMAVTGRGTVVRKFPLIPGIDFAGIVEASTHPGIAVGDRVVANGWELSHTHHGGFAQKARVKGDWLVKIPDVFSTRDAMAIKNGGDGMNHPTAIVFGVGSARGVGGAGCKRFARERFRANSMFRIGAGSSECGRPAEPVAPHCLV